MMDIERISKKIREEKDNLIAKAFTCQISSLLLTNGIVPIMTEHKFEELETITDSERYKLVYELGVTFDSLDTTEHDKQIRAEVIEEFYNRLNKYKSDMNTANYPWNYVEEAYIHMQKEQYTCFDCKYHFMSDCYLECQIKYRINNDNICKNFEQLKENKFI